MVIRITGSTIDFGTYSIRAYNDGTYDGVQVVKSGTTTVANLRASSYVSNISPLAASTANGFVAGGITAGSPSGINNVDRYPYTAPFATATDVGDLFQSRGYSSSQTSRENAYTATGFVPPTSTTLNTIDRYPVTAPFVTATDLGDVSVNRFATSGQSSLTDGFVTGGVIPPSTPYGNVDEFPFASPFTTSTGVGTLNINRQYLSGHSSGVHGFAAVGSNPSTPGFTLAIERFPFSAPFLVATTIGDLISTRNTVGSSSSRDNGYVAGGFVPGSPTYLNTIERFPFSATTVAAVDVGDLVQTRRNLSGQSSSTNSYFSGGGINPVPAPTNTNTIDRFPVTSPFVTATDVGDVTAIKELTVGHQY